MAIVKCTKMYSFPKLLLRLPVICHSERAQQPVLSVVEGSRGISACDGKSGLGIEIPRIPSVATLLSVARNDGGRVVTFPK
jgi:hypothetical protein